MSLFVNPFQFQNDEKGRAAAFATYDFYKTGSFSRLDTYADSKLTVVNPNPVVADAAGRFPAIYTKNDVPYRVVYSERLYESIDAPVKVINTRDDVIFSANELTRQLVVRSEDDLPEPILAPDGAMRHFIEKGTNINIDTDNLIINNGFWTEGEESTFITEVRFSSNSVYTLTYLGTDALFFSNNMSRLTIRDGVFQAANFGTPFCDLTGSPNPGTLSVYSIDVCTLFGFGPQKLYNINFPLLFQAALVNVAPMLMHNCDFPNFNAVTLNTQIFGSFLGPGIVMTGMSDGANYTSIDTSFLDNLFSSDSVIAIDSGLNIDSTVNLVNTGFTIGNFFEPDIINAIGQFQDLSTLLSGTVTAYENDGYGAVTVTHSGDAYLGLNVTHSGTTNYNGTFKIIRIIGNTQYVMNATYVADESDGSYVGSGVRATAVVPFTFTDFRTVNITNTTFYNGSFECHNCTGNTFDIDATFSGNDSGDFLVSSLNETDVNVNAERNGLLPDSTTSGSIVYEPASPVIVVGSGADWTDLDSADWSAFGLERFTSVNTGVLTYIGINPIKIAPIGLCTLEQSGGGSQLTGARLAYRDSGGVWAAIDGSIGSTRNGQPTQVTTKSPVITVNPGGEIKMQVNNIGGTADVEVTTAAIHSK